MPIAGGSATLHAWQAHRRSRPRPDTVTVITFGDVSGGADHPSGMSVPGGPQYDGRAGPAAGIAVARRHGSVLASRRSPPHAGNVMFGIVHPARSNGCLT